MMKGQDEGQVREREGKEQPRALFRSPRSLRSARTDANSGANENASKHTHTHANARVGSFFTRAVALRLGETCSGNSDRDIAAAALERDSAKLLRRTRRVGAARVVDGDLDLLPNAGLAEQLGALVGPRLRALVATAEPRCADRGERDAALLPPSGRLNDDGVRVDDVDDGAAEGLRHRGGDVIRPEMLLLLLRIILPRARRLLRRLAREDQRPLLHLGEPDLDELHANVALLVHHSAVELAVPPHPLEEDFEATVQEAHLCEVTRLERERLGIKRRRFRSGRGLAVRGLRPALTRRHRAHARAHDAGEGDDHRDLRLPAHESSTHRSAIEHVLDDDLLGRLLQLFQKRGRRLLIEALVLRDVPLLLARLGLLVEHANPARLRRLGEPHELVNVGRALVIAIARRPDVRPPVAHDSGAYVANAVEIDGTEGAADRVHLVIHLERNSLPNHEVAKELAARVAKFFFITAAVTHVRRDQGGERQLNLRPLPRRGLPHQDHAVSTLHGLYGRNS